jgi:hypothetical protein
VGKARPLAEPTILIGAFCTRAVEQANTNSAREAKRSQPAQRTGLVIHAAVAAFV